MPDLDFDGAVHLLHQHSNEPQGAKEAITFLAEAGSKSSTDRERLADPAVVTSLLALLDASLTNPSQPSPATLPTIRCIGNAVHSSNEARQIITDHGFSWFPKSFTAAQDDSDFKLRAFHALYNICLDFEPAQKRCYEEHLHEDLLRLWVNLYQDPPNEFLEWFEQFGELLLSVCEKRGKGDGVRDDVTREFVLDFTLILRGRFHEGGAEDVATAVELVLIYLRDESEHEKFTEQGLIGKVWRVLMDVEDYILNPSLNDHTEAQRLMPPLSTSLTWCLSDIAAHPKFAEYYGKDSEFIHSDIFDAIKRSDYRLVGAACQVLGNMLWSLKDTDPSAYSIDVMDADLHKGLLDSVTGDAEATALHSVVGLLMQLCRHSEEYKARLCGDPRLSSVLSILCESDSKEVRQGGMKLLQLLGKDDPAIREEYAGLAKRVMESLMAEQSPSQANPGQQNTSVVEIPD